MIQKKLDQEETKKTNSKKNIISLISNYKIGKDTKKDIQFIDEKIDEWNKIGSTKNTSKLNSNLINVYTKLLENLKIEEKELSKIKS